MQTVLEQNRVTVRGTGDTALVFAHGFGCDQATWQRVSSRFERDYRVVTYDLTGCGQSDGAAYDRARHASLAGHASDLLAILSALELEGVRYVGHSAGGMIGVLAAIREPARFSALALVAASPSYIDQPGYVGGNERSAIDGVLAGIDRDYLAWCDGVVPAAVGNPERPELGEELVRVFKRASPELAKHFARAIFLSDFRSVLPSLQTPALVVQTAQDLFVPVSVGRYLSEHVAHGTFVQLRAAGHYPQLADPEELTEVLRGWLNAAPA
jgi:sigma-B regulation protein RsbQ